MIVLSRLKKILLHNAPLKVASLLLAIVVWYGAGIKQNVEFTINLPLEIRNVPDDFILVGNPPENVRVRLRGRGRFLKFSLSEASVAVDASESEEGMFLRPITTSDVILPENVDAVVSEVVEPRMLRVEVRAKRHKLVRAEPVLAGELPSGYTLVGPPRAVPDEIELIGPADIVEPLTKILLEDLELSRVKGSVVTKRRVDLAGLDRVTASPGEVEVVVTAERIGQARFPAVPVRIDWGDRSGRGSVVPNTVGILLSGPASVVSVLRADTLALRVDAVGLPVGSHTFRADVIGPARVAFLPAGEGDRAAGASAQASAHLGGAMALPQGVEIVEILPSYFSLVVERAGSRVRRGG